MNKFITVGALAITALLASCKNDIEPKQPTAGSVDFTNYIAYGNSLTAGYQDGTLYRKGQQLSYPALLAEKFAQVGGGEFKQALLLDEAGYPVLKNVLGYKADCATGEIGLGPVQYSGTINAGNATNISEQGPFNNMGIPGIRVLDLMIPGYASMNPYAKRMLPADVMSTTLLPYFSTTKPTFFTCWLGNNDVLGYASSGGTGVVGGYDTKDITDVNIFKATYDAFVDAIAATGAKGVLATIPDVVSTPAFNTIPYNGLVLTRKGQADSLTMAYSPLGIKFEVGANPFIIADATAPGGMRQMKQGELIILSASDSLKCAGWGSVKPIPDAYTLTQSELENINTATSAFNNIIKEAATRNNLALFDANNYLKFIQSGVSYNGAKYGVTFVTGGLFSLDGVHLTPRGYALVANQFIKSINEKYNSTLEEVDVNKYPGVIYPGK